MQTVSSEFLTAERSNTARTPFKFSFDGEMVTEGITNVSLTMELCSSGQYSIGNFNSSSITITFFTGTLPMSAFVGKVVSPYFGYEVDAENETVEWVQKGYYIIPDSGVSQAGGYTTITAYDASYFMTDQFESQLDFSTPKTVYAVLSEVLKKASFPTKLDVDTTITTTAYSTSFSATHGKNIVLHMTVDGDETEYTYIAGTAYDIETTWGTIDVSVQPLGTTAISVQLNSSYSGTVVLDYITYGKWCVCPDVGSSGVGAITVYNAPTGTVREVIAYLAGLCGLNATMHNTQSNNIRFKGLTEQSLAFTTDDYGQGGLTLESDGETPITQLVCDQFVSPILDGDPTGIYIGFSSSDITTQTEADALATRIGITDEVSTTLSYRGYSLTTLNGFPQVEVGDVLSIDDYYGQTTNLKILSMSIAWQGNLQTSFSATVPLEQVVEAKPQHSITEGVKVANRTAQYFWAETNGSDNGVHITEVPKDTFVQDRESGGHNLLIRSDGLAIRDGLSEISNFNANGMSVKHPSTSDELALRYAQHARSISTSTNFVASTDGDYWCVQTNECVYYVSYIMYDGTGLSSVDYVVRNYDGYGEIVLLNFPANGTQPNKTLYVEYSSDVYVPCLLIGDRSYNYGTLTGVGKNTVAVGENIVNATDNSIIVGRSNAMREALADYNYDAAPAIAVGNGGELSVSSVDKTFHVLFRSAFWSYGGQQMQRVYVAFTGLANDDYQSDMLFSITLDGGIFIASGYLDKEKNVGITSYNANYINAPIIPQSNPTSFLCDFISNDISKGNGNNAHLNLYIPGNSLNTFSDGSNASLNVLTARILWGGTDTTGYGGELDVAYIENTDETEYKTSFWVTHNGFIRTEDGLSVGGTSYLGGDVTSEGNITDGSGNVLADKVESDFIVTQSFDLGTVSFTAGTVGTVGQNKSTTITKTGYTPIALAVRFISSTSLCIFSAFMNNARTSAYVQVIRAVASAQTINYSVYLDVTYLKN